MDAFLKKVIFTCIPMHIHFQLYLARKKNRWSEKMGIITAPSGHPPYRPTKSLFLSAYLARIDLYSSQVMLVSSYLSAF